MTDPISLEQALPPQVLAALDVAEPAPDLEDRLMARARELGLLGRGATAGRALRARRLRLLSVAAVLVAAAALAAYAGWAGWRGDDAAAAGGSKLDAGIGAGAAGGGAADAPKRPRQPDRPGEMAAGPADGGDGAGQAEEGAAPPDPPPNCSVTVTVSVQGEARAGVRVDLIRDANRGLYPAKIMTAATNEAGQALFEEVSPGGWKALAAMDGFSQPAANTLLCPGGGEALTGQVALSRAAVLVFGTVTDREGTPLADSYLEASKTGSVSRDYEQRLLIPVDAEGRYRVWLPDDAEDYRLVASAVGHQMTGGRVPPHEVQVELNFRLARNSVLTGQVVGPDGPVPRAEMRIRIKMGRETSSRNSWADAQGKFALEGGPGEIRLSAHKGRLWGTLAVPTPQEGRDLGELTVRMQEGRSLSGVLRLPSGAPAAGQRLSVFDEASGLSLATQTDDEGRFFFDGLPTTAHLKIFPLGDKRPFLDRVVEVAPGEDQVEITFVPAD